MKTISTNSLQIILGRLFKKLGENQITEFNFENDYYWAIENEKMILMTEEPKLVVGSLSDDIDFLNSLIVKNYQTEYLELDRLSALFKFMSQKLQ